MIYYYYYYLEHPKKKLLISVARQDKLLDTFKYFKIEYKIVFAKI